MVDLKGCKQKCRRQSWLNHYSENTAFKITLLAGGVPEAQVKEAIRFLLYITRHWIIWKVKTLKLYICSLRKKLEQAIYFYRQLPELHRGHDFVGSGSLGFRNTYVQHIRFYAGNKLIIKLCEKGGIVI